MSDDEEYERDAEGEQEAEELEGSDFDGDEEAEGEDKGDGLANTMMGILGQKTKSKIPVLAGRKTKLMKQMQEEKDKEKAATIKKEAKRRKMKQLMGEFVGDDDNSTSSFNLDFEKQLKKLATKGAVALFNAVAKAKRDKILGERKDKPHSSSHHDDDDHSVGSFGSLKDLKGVHNKRPAAAAPMPEKADAAKRPKTNWSVLSNTDTAKLSAGGWDQEEDEDL